jgi:hypothetical protein
MFRVSRNLVHTQIETSYVNCTSLRMTYDKTPLPKHSKLPYEPARLRIS